MKRSIILGVFLIILSILIVPISPSIQNEQPRIEPAGVFNVHLPPEQDGLMPHHIYWLTGYCQFNGSRFEQQFPNQWFWQYTTMVIDDKPEWISASFPEASHITRPDGTRQNFSMQICVKDDAPAYIWEQIVINITTTKYICVKYPLLKSFIGEYNYVQSFSIRAGYVPSMEIMNPPSIEMKPNSMSKVNITIKNTGNARSLLQFSGNVSEEDYDKGWSISYSESLIIGRNETFDVPVKIFSPITDDYIDEWMLCTIKVTIRSLPEPMGSILNETATITAHCLS